MDKLFDTYKQIVDRAIFLGLLPEDSKPYYLSACGEEAATESSNKVSDSCGLPDKHGELQSSYEKGQSLSETNADKLNKSLSSLMKKIQEKDEALCTEQIYEGGRSIENYSILDINNYIKMTNSIGSDSEPSDFIKASSNITSGDFPAIKLNKVRRKPKKNEVIDFQIPIYLDIKRNKVSTKSAKPKRHLSLHGRESTNFESSTLQRVNGNERIMDAFQSFEPKSRSKIPKRYNLTNNKKTTPKLRTYQSNTYEHDNKYIEQNIFETLSPKRIEKNERPSRAISTPLLFSHSKSKVNSPLMTDKVEKENIDYLEKLSRLPQREAGGEGKPESKCTQFKNSHVRRLAFRSSPDMLESKNLAQLKENIDYMERLSRLPQREADGEGKPESKCTQFQNSHIRRIAFRSSPDMLEYKNLAQLPKSDKSRFFKHATECKRFEKLDSPSDDPSCNESSDSEAQNKHRQKLINLNIICQFFSNDSSDRKQDSASLESFPQLEVENEKITSKDVGKQPPKEGSAPKSRTHFLSKLFSRTRIH